MKARTPPGGLLLGAGGVMLALLLGGLVLSVTGGTGQPGAAAATGDYYVPMVYRINTPTPLPVTPPASGDWHAVLNYYRASSRLPGPTEIASWSDGDAQHARYMVKNDVLAASEGTSTPEYSQAGADAAPNGLLLLTDTTSTTDRQAFDSWMSKPFHALSLLDPAWLSTGFGSYREEAGAFDPFKMGAALDVRRGLGAIPALVSFPLKWPEHNATVSLTQYDGSEQPDPLSSCSGYSPPSGLPIILQLGPGSLTPNVTAHSFKHGSTSLPHCIFDETNYTNSIAQLQSLGRSLLDASDAVVLIPQQPLTPGYSYTVSITANGEPATWTFQVAP